VHALLHKEYEPNFAAAFSHVLIHTGAAVVPARTLCVW